MSYWKHPDIRPGGLLEDLTHPFSLTMAAELLSAHGEPPIVWMPKNLYTDTPPEYWGIFIGVNDSVPLKGPWPDAMGMKDKLDGYPGYSKTRKRLHLSGMNTSWVQPPGYPPYPGNASWQNITDSINWVYNNVDDCDIVVFYFAGHGYNTTDTSGEEPDNLDEGIWVGELGNEKVSDDMLYAEFKKFENKSRVGLILIFDSCHSGGMVDGTSDLQNIKNPHAILMACERFEKAIEYEFDGIWHGAYTYYLLEGLNSTDGTTKADKEAGDDNKITTPSELHAYAKPKTETKTSNKQHPTKETKSCYKWPCTWIDFPYIPSEYAWRFWDGKPGSGQPQDGHYQAGEEFRLIFYGRSDHAWRRDIAVALAAKLEAAPIKIDVDLTLAGLGTCEWAVMETKNFHMYTGGWIFMGPEPDYLYDLYNGEMYRHPGVPNNYGCYNCTEFNYWSKIVKFPGARTMPEIREACLRAQEEWATPCCICAVPLISTAAPKAFARAYTGGNGGVPIGDGEDKYRGLMWKDIVNELGSGENSYWTKLNAHPAGYETGDCQNMTLRYGFKVSSLRKLNIIYSSWYWDREVLTLIYDTLMMRDPNTLGDLIPWLAKKLETFEWVDPEDGETKTGVKVTLRPGVKWSDGHPLQAHDVVFTFMELPRKLNERGFPEPWWSSYVWPTAKCVYEVDPCNVVILYDYLAPAWAKVWVGIAVPIMPRHIWKTIVDTGDPTGALPPNLPDPTLTGTGPFKRDPAADWYNPPSWIKLVKNTQFFHYCPIDVDVEIDAPEKYKGYQVFPPSTPADQLKFTIQIQNMYWNQCRGSELWIDKYVYFSNATGEYLLPGYPENIPLPGRNAFLHNITHVDMSNPISSIWEQTGGCPPQTEVFHVTDWEDNCDDVLSACDKLFLECITDPLKSGWYHVETVNPLPPYGDPPIMIEVAFEDKEEIGLADLPYPYNTMTSWPKCHYDIKVAVHVKGPPMIWVYTWTLSEFLAGTPAHYELVPNPWVCQWINATFNFWVTIPEDLNLDCKVNILDAILLAGAFGAKIGAKNWNARADINGDLRVNILDCIKLAGKFGWGY